MTTYELPPEPAIGESVQDVHGRTWKHEGVNRWALKGDDYANDPETRSWHRVLLSAPLTLIEPDPWPTAPLIVATLSSPSRSTKRLLLACNSNGDYVDGVRSALQEIDTLTNVVPVKPVPVAELDALRASIKALGYGPDGTTGMPGSLLDTATRLIAATDALGVDQ